VTVFKPSIFRISAFLIMASLLPVLTHAADEKRQALVIGNGKYMSAPLKNPVNDARDIAAALKKSGFEVVLGEDWGQREMEDAIIKFGRKLQSGGVGLFYYAGHGIQVAGANYLLPVDARIESESDVRFEAVDAGRVLGKMQDADNRLNIVILDACRNNPFARSFRDAQVGLARMDAPAGALVAYATAPGSVAEDGEQRNGLYTGTLLKYLLQPDIEIGMMFRKVREEVLRQSGKKQVPWESSSLVGEFHFMASSGSVVSGTSTSPGEATPTKAESVSPNHSQSKTSPIGPQGRYIDHKNGTVTDSITGLMWMRCAIGQSWTGNTCNGKAKEMSWEDSINYSISFANYSDWRLPTIDELSTLVYCSNGQPNFFSNAENASVENSDWGCSGKPVKDHTRPTIFQEAFPNCPSSLFWSNSHDVHFPGPHGIFFGFGSISGNNSTGVTHIRLVRKEANVTQDKAQSITNVNKISPSIE